MDYQVVIPSYKRADQIAKKTLPMLQRQGVPSEKITIFVASEEELTQQQSIPPHLYHRIVVGVPGVVEQRQFISDAFPESTYIISFDDDVELVQEGKRNPIHLPTFFKEAQNTMEQENVSLWGVYPVDNPFFMEKAPKTTTHLTQIVGALYGYISPAIPVESNGGLEDKERSLRQYEIEGKTLRFNHIGIKTKQYGVGGNEAPDRRERHKKDQEALLKLFPHLVKPITRKNGQADLRLRDSTKGGTEGPLVWGTLSE